MSETPGAGSSRREHIGRRIAWGAHLTLAAVTLLAYLSPYVSPGRLWPFAFAALAYPALVLGLGSLAGFWIFRGRYRRAALSAVVILLGYGHLRQYLGWHRPPDDLPAEAVAFASYNLLGGRAFGDLDDEALAAKADDLVACLAADVIAFEESPAYNRTADAIDAGLLRAGVGYAYRPPDLYLSLHSRYPILDPRVVGRFNRINGIVRADVVLPPGDTVRVLVAHLESNRVRLDPQAVAIDVAQADPQAYRTVRGVAANYRQGARRRSRQAAVLADETGASPYPVVLLGDLNDVPLSYTLGELRRAGLLDAFREAGRGSGITYGGPLPALRIDYVLATDAFRPLTASVLDCDFSDHKPTRAVLAVR